MQALSYLQPKEPLPVKQGLKPYNIFSGLLLRQSKRAASSKTRIETQYPAYPGIYHHTKRAASSKTRIETFCANVLLSVFDPKEPLPVKQGLKL